MFLVEHEVTHWHSIRNFPQLGDEAGTSEHHAGVGFKSYGTNVKLGRGTEMMSTGGGAAEAICTENGC